MDDSCPACPNCPYGGSCQILMGFGYCELDDKCSQCAEDQRLGYSLHALEQSITNMTVKK